MAMQDIPKKNVKNLDPKFSVIGGPGEGPMRKIARLPQSEQARMEKALADLMKKRAEEAKRTGSWPNYKTN
jgi:hypothetical protein